MRMYWVLLVIGGILVYLFQLKMDWKKYGNLIDGKKNKSSLQDSKNSLQILLWAVDNVHMEPFYGVNDLEASKCSLNCQVTRDHSLIHNVDAVVFSGLYYWEMPPQRKWNQIRIFFRLEPPRTTEIEILPHVYNWTMTYRTDSDIPLLYGQFHPTHSNTIPAKNLNVELHLRERYWSKKTRLVAWIVSNCKTKSHREDFVAKLKTFVPVDVYGACGTLKCPHSRVEPGQSCFKSLGPHYKFYLALENSLCVDYVTEKLFEPLAHGMVPIVYGEVNYTKVAPPRSFIDASAFKSVEALAHYLKFLDENPQEYLKYFLWTHSYSLAPGSINNFRPHWCQLCSQLWKKSNVNGKGHRVIDPQYSKVYDNISLWWGQSPGNEGAACREAPNFN